MSDIKSIKSWAEEDRPREKLSQKGRESLSNAELLAIIIGSGSRDESAVSLAKRVLAQAESLNNLGRQSLEFFMNFKGIGEAKAIAIAAALELGRRRQAEPSKVKKSITSSTDAYEVLAHRLADLNHEEFWVVLLNNKNHIISQERISTGGVSATVVDAKLVFKSALSKLASRIILYHNHPSGSIKPSQQDISLTKKLSQAGALLDISVVDHIIIGEKGYYSFKDENLLI